MNDTGTPGRKPTGQPVASAELAAATLSDAEIREIRLTVEALGSSIQSPALEQFARYRAEVLAWSRRLNLVSRTDEGRLVEAHIRDSLRPLPHLPQRKGAWIGDLGSGAGFPGIPLKIIRPDLRMTLIESSEKRRVFLAHISRSLGLRDVEAAGLRAEELARDPAYAGRLDAIVARAAGKLDDLITWSAPLLGPNGLLITYKPSDCASELRDAGPVAEAHGFTPPVTISEVDLGWQRGILVAVRRRESA